MHKLSLFLIASTLGLLSVPARAHMFDRTLVEIVGRFQTGTFTVFDQGNCVARITATVADPSIASVTPAEATAIRQTFTVSSLKGGETKIRVSWYGLDDCNDVGSAEVTVIVRTGPDLTIEQSGLGMFQVEPYRVGGYFLRAFFIQNIGDDPTTGTISLIAGVPESFRVHLPQKTCPGTVTVTPTSFRCDISGSLEAGGRLPVDRSPSILFEPTVEGIFSSSAEIQGGGDINLANNSADVMTIKVFHARYCEHLFPPPPKRVEGRVRPNY